MPALWLWQVSFCFGIISKISYYTPFNFIFGAKIRSVFLIIGIFYTMKKGTSFSAFIKWEEFCVCFNAFSDRSDQLLQVLIWFALANMQLILLHIFHW